MSANGAAAKRDMWAGVKLHAVYEESSHWENVPMGRFFVYSGAVFSALIRRR